MKTKQTLENSSSYPHVNVTNVVGTFVSSFVLVIVLILGCVACRRKEKKGRNSNRQCIRNDQDENEYQIPDINIPRDADKSPTVDGANIYTLPEAEPTVVYTDLDKLALKSGTVSRNQPAAQPPTQYAIIDEEKLNAARKERQEKFYGNVDNRNATKPVIYQNANIT